MRMSEQSVDGLIQSPQPLPEISTTRDRAELGINEVMSKMPMRRAIAAKHGIEALRGLRQHFSLIDVINFDKGNGSKDEETSGSQVSESQDFATASEILDEYSPEDPGAARFPLKDLARMFGDDLGVITLPAGFRLSDSEFSDFFTNARHIGNMKKKKGMVELGGVSLAISAVKGVDLDTKLNTMEADLEDGIGVAARVAANRESVTNTVDFMLYLGVLNYLKTHSITLFHQLTLDERTLSHPDSDPTYQMRREEAFDLMRSFTRMYYQTMVGASYDKFDAQEALNKVKAVKGYVSFRMNDRLGPDDGSEDYVRRRSLMSGTFKIPEAANPIDIVVGAQEAVRKNPESEVVVGVPSGGTEIGVVLQLMYEVLNGKSVSLDMLPISIHSSTKTADAGQWADYLLSRGLTIKGKNILLADDNSSSGSTLTIAANALRRNGANSISVHVVDIDRSRFVKEPSFRTEKESDSYFDPAASPSTIGDIALDHKGGYQRKKNLRDFIERAIYRGVRVGRDDPKKDDAR